MLALGTKVYINPNIAITDDPDKQILGFQRDATVGVIVDVDLSYDYPYEVKFVYSLGYFPDEEEEFDEAFWSFRESELIAL